MTFPNEIEKTKKEIEVLTAKLALLEEMEKHQKSPAEEAYKRWWGEYPGTDTWTGYDETRWVGFQMGFNAAYEETMSKYQPTPQTPESNEWRTAALRFGENLCDISPYGYYVMTSDEWLEWAKSVYEKTASEWLQLVHKEKTKKIMNEVKDLQEKDWTYKVTDEKGETNPYKNYMNSVKNLQENNWYVDPKTLLKSNWEPTQVSAFRYNQRTYIRHEDMGLFAWLIVDKADPIEDVDTLKILENEMNKQKEEYPYRKYTPEETEKSLKDAMETAKENGVFDEPKPETLTLKNLLKKWEFDFSAKWENPKNRSSELYEEEVERFIQMFIEWLPTANKDYGDSNWEHGWNTGYNAYRNNLMRKLK